MDQVRCVVPAGDICGEGAIWHPDQNALYWTDINRFLVHRYDPVRDTTETWFFDEPVTAVNLTTDKEVLLLVLGSNVSLWSPREHPKLRRLYSLPTAPEMRFNDARVDPRGSLWTGTMRNNVGPQGERHLHVEFTDGILYRIDPDGTSSTWREHVGISNTVAWSPDRKRFYFGDSPANTIYAFNYDERTGAIADGTTFLTDYPHGSPDGSTVDARGYLWNARYGGRCLVRVAPRMARLTGSYLFQPQTQPHVLLGAPNLRRFISPALDQPIVSPVAFSRSKRKLAALPMPDLGFPQHKVSSRAAIRRSPF